MEKIVLKYLKQKGYSNAINALKSDAPHTAATLDQMIVDIEKQDALISSSTYLFVVVFVCVSVCELLLFFVCFWRTLCQNFFGFNFDRLSLLCTVH